MQCTQINQLQTFANSDALSSSNFNCFSVISPLVPVLWARPTCLSSKGPKPHHLWCSLAKWECQQKLDMLTSKLISFAWSSLGTSLGAWNVSSYLLRPCLLSTLPLLTSGRPRAMLRNKDYCNCRNFSQIPYLLILIWLLKICFWSLKIAMNLKPFFVPLCGKSSLKPQCFRWLRVFRGQLWTWSVVTDVAMTASAKKLHHQLSQI